MKLFALLILLSELGAPMQIKPGVRLLGLQPQMTVALSVAESVYARYGAECVLTSAVDGNHSRASLHYKGYAVDLRIWNVPQSKRPTLVNDLREALGTEYDVILERDHIHVEWDPKRAAA